MDYRPGTPLTETMAIVKRPIKPEQREEANRLEANPPIRGSLEQPLWCNGITNLTDWMGNVIMPTLAALFFALAVLRFAHGQAHTYTPWAGFLCLMVSGVLRGIEKFAAQAAWNNPDLIWITLRGLVNWTCNVFLPVYAVLQLLQGLMQYSGVGHRVYAGGIWMRHFAAAAMCLSLSGLLRLAEWFITKGLGGIS